MTTRELFINKLREANEKNALIPGYTETCALGRLIQAFGEEYQQNDWLSYAEVPTKNFYELTQKELWTIEELFENNTTYKYFDIIQFGPIKDYFEEIQKECEVAIDIIDRYLSQLEHANTDIDCYV